MQVTPLHALGVITLLGSSAAAQLMHAPAGPLVVEPLFFAEDTCLAPTFESPGCPAPGHSEPLLSASAALLASDLSEQAPALTLDPSILLAGEELSYICGAPECARPRRIIA